MDDHTSGAPHLSNWSIADTTKVRDDAEYPDSKCCGIFGWVYPVWQWCFQQCCKQFSVSSSLFMTLMERALHRNSTPPKSLQPLYSILHRLECKPMYPLILSNSCEYLLCTWSHLAWYKGQYNLAGALCWQTGKCDCRSSCQFHLCFWCILFLILWYCRIRSAQEIFSNADIGELLKSKKCPNWFLVWRANIDPYFPPQKYRKNLLWKVSKAKWNAEKNWGFRHGPHAENWQSCGTHWWEHGLSLSPQGHQCLLNIKFCKIGWINIWGQRKPEFCKRNL